MRILLIALKNVYELFVEDGSLVLVVLIWLALAYAAARLLHVPPEGAALLLAAGCLVALGENTLRAAARSARARRP
jgi:hypothetical protein